MILHLSLMERKNKVNDCSVYESIKSRYQSFPMKVQYLPVCCGLVSKKEEGYEYIKIHHPANDKLLQTDMPL